MCRREILDVYRGVVGLGEMYVYRGLFGGYFFFFLFVNVCDGRGNYLSDKVKSLLVTNQLVT